MIISLDPYTARTKKLNKRLYLLLVPKVTGERGSPSANWSTKKLESYESKSNQAISKLDQALSVLNDVPYSSNKMDVIKSIKDIQEMMRAELELVKTYIETSKELESNASGF